MLESRKLFTLLFWHIEGRWLISFVVGFLRRCSRKMISTIQFVVQHFFLRFLWWRNLLLFNLKYNRWISISRKAIESLNDPIFIGVREIKKSSFGVITISKTAPFREKIFLDCSNFSWLAPFNFSTNFQKNSSNPIINSFYIQK